MTIPGLLFQVIRDAPTGYTLPPHWGWYVVLYFFLGGLAAGCYFIATMLLLAGDRADRETIRIGYLISFPLLLVCAVLLIVDLGVPSRFWHMLIQNKTPPELQFKPWSPISLGTWVITAFGLFSFTSFVGALVEMGRVRWRPLVRLDRWARERPRPFAVAWGVLGAFFGFLLAGYTGVLVNATSIPLWHDARLLGGLFLVSAASSSYAFLTLALLRRGRTPDDPSEVKLARADRFNLVLELAVLTVMLILLGPVARPMLTGGFGVLFWIGVVGIGIIIPLLLHRIRTGGWDDRRRLMVGAVCVLIGGLLLRFVVVMSPQYPMVPPWAL